MFVKGDNRFEFFFHRSLSLHGAVCHNLVKAKYMNFHMGTFTNENKAGR